MFIELIMVNDRIKFYKYGFWVVLLISLTGINYISFSNKVLERRIEKEEAINKRRLERLFNSNINMNRRVSSFEGQEIISNQKRKINCAEKIVLILLEKYKCGECQIKELQLLERHRHRFRELEIKLIGITLQEYRETVIFQKRISRANFPIYVVDKDIFTNMLSFSRNYPQILFIEKNIISAEFQPLTKDEKFSEMFYEKLFEIVKKEKSFK